MENFGVWMLVRGMRLRTRDMGGFGQGHRLKDCAELVMYHLDLIKEMGLKVG